MEKLRSAREFRRILDHGRSYANALFVVYALPPEGPSGRIGVVVGRKFGTAVVRNRVRRRVLEAFRQGLGDPEMVKDVVIIPRHAARDAEFRDLCRALWHILYTAHALRGPQDASGERDVRI
ncbi:MAG TPA: ribonuclease P protein component [Firmicutes bacterium]|nr:ribonuclease P protein component [Bacillota bacterium]